MDKIAVDMERMQSSAEKAFMRAQWYYHEVREIQRYYSPFRAPTTQRSRGQGGRSDGANLTNHLFDGTGVAASFNFSSQMRADWLPPFDEWVKLKASEDVEEAQKAAFNVELDKIGRKLHSKAQKVHLAADEMFQDVFAGTGIMSMMEGTRHRPLQATAIPILEVAVKDGPFGDPWHIWWRREYELGELQAIWPEGQFSDSLAKEIRKEPEGKTVVTQYTYYDLREDRWILVVWCDKAKKQGEHIWAERFRTQPIIVTRYFKVPGEAFGRGLAHLGLPFVKTANKTRELALKAAAFAIMGIWLRRNDGVFNPDTVRFEPLAMWQVKSTGGAGSLGPSLSRLPVPQNFDVTSIVMREERENIKRVLLDDDLPADQEAIRSATEIAARLNRAARRRGGAAPRMAYELIDPIARRGIDILEAVRQLKTNLTVEQMLYEAEAIAPAAAAQRGDKVERAVGWIQMIVMLLGPQAALLFGKVEELAPEIGRWMGNEERFIRPKEEVGEIKDIIATIMAAQSEQAAAGAGGAPQPPLPGANGMVG